MSIIRVIGVVFLHRNCCNLACFEKPILEFSVAPVTLSSAVFRRLLFQQMYIFLDLSLPWDLLSSCLFSKSVYLLFWKKLRDNTLHSVSPSLLSQEQTPYLTEEIATPERVFVLILKPRNCSLQVLNLVGRLNITKEECMCAPKAIKIYAGHLSSVAMRQEANRNDFCRIHFRQAYSTL